MKNWFRLKEIFTILDLDMSDNPHRIKQKHDVWQCNYSEQEQKKLVQKITVCHA